MSNLKKRLEEGIQNTANNTPDPATPTTPKRKVVIPTPDQIYGSVPVPRRVRTALQQVPENAIVQREDGTLSLGNFTMTGYGLEVPENADISDFENAFEVFFKIRDQINLWIGDALVAYDRIAWGKTEEIAQYFGYEPASIHNLKSICKQVEFSRRREVYQEMIAQKNDIKPLAVGHYDAIKGLESDQQDDLMRKALLEGLSVKALRAEVKALTKPELEDMQPTQFQKRFNKLNTTIYDDYRLAQTEYSEDEILKLIETYRYAAEQLERLHKK
ncbi:hypothetical protein G4Y79_12945 [Phototrophicus methaneseepsis]|uniref:Uncharacterized protein n=1 Tax=Phototrophicus methaneseepsis TaxID=2710758 RepID=A0A7S8E5D9_9CHLR|nr:hypothetical protein [Phototrophicus methaneseepsis]QPC80618.1 hypothetical protein G4Y79_12945 [Phototrophicus methaneseepsis]